MTSLASAVTAASPTHFNATIGLLLDRLLFLSPRTWWGLIECFSINESLPVDGKVLGNALVGGLLLPLLLSSLWNDRFFQRPFHNKRIVLCCAPWTLQSVYQVLRQCWFVIQATRQNWKFRFVALPSAHEALQERIASNRAYSTRRYNVFLPPSPQNNEDDAATLSNSRVKGDVGMVDNLTTTQHEQQITGASSSNSAVLFFPGFGVPHEAYSKAASLLSDSGVVVVVVSMEPCRIAFRNLGGDCRPMKKIIQKVEQLCGRELQWSLMGHSLGSFCAMRIYTELHGKSDMNFHSLVLWGIAAFYFMSTDMTKYNVPILKVQGTNDAVLELRRPWQSLLDAHFSPSTTKTEWISGGSHGGFADYYDGVMDTEEPHRQSQQRKACDLTVEFLQSKH